MTFSPDSFAPVADLSVDFAPLAVDSLTPAELVEAQRAVAEIGRRQQAQAAVIAARIAYLSRPDLGLSGMAKQRGIRTPVQLIQHVAGVSKREAQTLVRVGTLMGESADAAVGTSGDDPSSMGEASTSPWMREAMTEVAAGRLSLEAADVIHAGLGVADDAVDAEALAAAAAQLLRDAPNLTIEQLAARARERRNLLDADGVRDREQHLRSRRYLYVTAQSDGMTRLNGLLDPESAAIVVAAYDAATSPRRGGPRFVSADEQVRADRLQADERTTEQIALDTFVSLIQLATDADDGKLLGSRRPPVRLLVTDRDLRNRSGYGFIEGQTEAVSIETIERHICSEGYVPLLFGDDGSSLNLGVTQRFHNARQRVLIAARDGGCINPLCDRPASWSEVHHINEFSKGGKTDLADGVLLCRSCHFMVHNLGWRVIREGAEYYLVPPASYDPARTPIHCPSKSPALRRLLATAP